ncbi:SigE family RNA polymerase sigma factor [Nostocoides veronense]|uniref:RNA polymerase sigma factor n=1 Tax=Nostocoides veronense TaxID=330836 RepID=UPI0031CF8502
MTAAIHSARPAWPALPTRRGEATHDVTALDFDSFYRDTAHRVIHLVYATTGDLTLAQDCTQEAYARAWQRWSQVSAADDPLSWVRTVARRLAISQWRKDTNRGEAHRRLALVPEEPARPAEDRAYVVAALKTLSPQHREVLALHYLLDMSVEQIADDLGSPVGTIKARLHHGRKALAEALRAKEGGHA